MTLRREFLVGLVTALALPLSARAERSRRIGILRSSPTPDRSLDALRHGLVARGYTEGQEFVFVYSFGDGDIRRLPELAAGLVTSGIDVIVTEGNLTTEAARAATQTVPIVMATSAAPQEAGLVQSLSRPGGNVTGLSSQAAEISGKLLELTKEIVPNLTRVAITAPPLTLDLFRAETNAAAGVLGVEIIEIVLALPDLDTAFSQATTKQVQAAVVRGRPFFSTAMAKMTVEHAAAHRLPVIYESRDFVEMGGLISYGVDVPDLYRRAAIFVDKILKGASPADLPVEQPTKFELVINLKTAKTLGLTVPQSLLARADEVIE